jgi:hypothetical protein
VVDLWVLRAFIVENHNINKNINGERIEREME